jgi:hypothetical protein
MQSLNQTLLKIKTALTAIEELKVYHYWRPRLQAPYCIWAEDGEGDSLHADNKKKEQVISGTIDYFTKEEFDDNVDAIQEALNDIEIGWELSSVDYEDETNLIHYTWTFETA